MTSTTQTLDGLISNVLLQQQQQVHYVTELTTTFYYVHSVAKLVWI